MTRQNSKIATSAALTLFAAASLLTTAHAAPAVSGLSRSRVEREILPCRSGSEVKQREQLVNTLHSLVNYTVSRDMFDHSFFNYDIPARFF